VAVATTSTSGGDARQPAFQSDALATPEAFFRSWRGLRTRRASPAIYVVGVVCISLAVLIELRFRMSRWTIGTALLAIFGSAASLVASRRPHHGGDFAWLPFFGSLWVASCVFIYETGGLESHFLFPSLAMHFIIGLAVQNVFSARSLAAFVAANLVAWAALAAFTPLGVPDFPHAFILSMLGVIVLGVSLCLHMLLREEPWLSGEVVGASSRLIEERILLAQAFETNAAKRAFLNAVNHEVRTPISIILGFIDLVLGEELSAKDREQCGVLIRQNGERLLGLVNDLLEFADIEAGRIGVSLAPVELRPFFQDFAARICSFAGPRSVAFDLMLHDALPATLETDPKIVSKILGCVVGYALRVEGSTRVEAVVRPSTGAGIEVSVSAVDGRLATLDPKTLFQPFANSHESQGAADRQRRLGLPLAWQLAELLGGSLTLTRDEAGVGGGFVLVLNGR